MQHMNRRYVLAGSVAAFAVTGFVPIRAAATTQSPTAHTVTIKKFKFDPAHITVRTGDTITWINQDLAPHTATADAKDWDTKKLQKGASKTLEVTAEMSTSYYCKFHPNMKGQITIE